MQLMQLMHLKKLAIIGSSGMLGSDLVKNLSPYFVVSSITKDNYSQYIQTKFDILVNVNGNSRRFWANQNPQDDFISSTASVYKSILDFPCDIYVYISTPDVYENHTSSKYTNENELINPINLVPYGFNKYLAELIVKKYKSKFLILRSAMILGNNLKKGPFYDILTGKSLYVTRESCLQLITTRAIAEIIRKLLDKAVTNEIINMGGIGNFSFTKIRNYFNNEIKILPEAETQIYEMNVEKLKLLYPSLKTTEEYLQEFLSIT